jgi:hypothetical protein
MIGVAEASWVVHAGVMVCGLGCVCARREL